MLKRRLKAVRRQIQKSCRMEDGASFSNSWKPSTVVAKVYILDCSRVPDSVPDD